MSDWLTLEAASWLPSLAAIRLIHTIIWALVAGCILALPFAAWQQRFRLGAVLSAVVLVECGVLVLNHGRCPLTDLAARLTTQRADNFDIDLPVWLAHNNKIIFGVLFLLSEALLAGCWIRASRRRGTG